MEKNGKRAECGERKTSNAETESLRKESELRGMKWKQMEGSRKQMEVQ